VTAELLESRQDAPDRRAPKERRGSERKAVRLQARVELPDGTVLEGQTVDVSHTGVGLFSPRLLQTDQDCKLTIGLSVHECATASSKQKDDIERVCASSASKPALRNYSINC
jgi:hypothetical protein